MIRNMSHCVIDIDDWGFEIDDFLVSEFKDEHAIMTVEQVDVRVLIKLGGVEEAAACADVYVAEVVLAQPGGGFGG